MIFSNCANTKANLNQGAISAQLFSPLTMRQKILYLSYLKEIIFKCMGIYVNYFLSYG